MEPRSEEEDQLPEDPDPRSTSVLAADAAASAGLNKKRTVEVDGGATPKRTRGVGRILKEDKYYSE